MKKFNFIKKHKNNSNKKYANKRNVHKKINAQKKVKKGNLKTKLSNIEIKPQFLIIGLVATITIISLIYFIFLKYSPIMNFKYEGYGISGKQITENLLGASGDKENRDSQKSNLSDNDGKNVSLAKIEEQGTIFKKLNSYFIGNKEKTEIDLKYPIYINDKNTIYNLSQDITLISKNFEQIAGYPNISITDGKVYNGNNLERADSKEYIFAKTEEGIYINLKEIKIITTANEYVLPVNSLMVFEEDVIRYYSVKNNILVFNEINDVDYNSHVIIKNVESDAVDTNTQNIQNEQNKENTNKVDKQYNYEELLTCLGVIESAKNDVEKEEIQKEDLTNDDGQKEEKPTTQKNETTTNALQAQKPENNEQTNAEYIKPEVTVEDFKAEVYTAKSNLTIKDPKARIIEAPTFEIYKDGKIYLRRVFKNSGEIQITGLVPETEYEIIGKYIYLNAENKKVENTFYKGTIKTKGYEALGTIELSKEEGEIYSNKIQIKNVKIISDLQNEAIKGINQIELETGNIKTVLKNNKVNELLEGKEVTIECSEGLKSNTKIEYAIKFYDKNGKKLKVENNKGTTRTSKQEPKVTVKIKEQDIVSVTLGVKLTNKDSVKLENYKYIITRPNGEKLKEERLSEHEKEIKLEDLDQNQYYKIKVYADYDLGDNKGIQKDVEIGNLVFATKPISTLGSLEMIVENKELTSKNAKISYKIDEDKTDKRLIQILNELTIKIVEVSQDFEVDVNEEGNNDETGSKENKDKKVVYTNTLTKEEIERLQLGEIKEINYENLKSNTKYTIEITGNVQLGNTQENIQVTYNYKEFTTLKIPAKVEIKNQFVTGNLIDFDIRIEDINNAVLNNTVRMELRNSSNDLIDLQELTTNEDFIRKTYEKLEENQTYKLSFYADQYNEGSTDETYKVNYLIKEIEIMTEPGISGNIGLTELTKKATGKNLVDIESKIKWHVYPNFNTNDYYGKEYNKETKILTLGGHGNFRRAVYDLREYAGQEVTMSFKAKAVSGSQIAYIQNSKKDVNRTAIQGLTTEWKDYQYTLKIDSTGYLGFYMQGGKGIEVKELQIELGNRKTNYEEFKYTLQSNYSINLEDKRDEIATNDYYIKIYEDNNLVKENRYEEIPEENVITNAIKTYEVQSGRQYKVELTIKMKEREYVLSSLEYDTKETEEIKGIFNKEDFLDIQQRGNYIVLGDIDLRGGINSQYRFGSDNMPFEGKIDFNGHKLIRDTKNTKDTVFHNIGKKGVIKNLVLDIYMNNIYEIYFFNGLFNNNYGQISNINVVLKECKDKANKSCSLIGNSNYGTINKFIVNLESELYGIDRLSCVVNTNYGIIKNGYIYGKNISGIYNSIESKAIGGLVTNNYKSGNINNVFSLVDINIGEQTDVINQIGNIALNSIDTAKIENVYSVISLDEANKYIGRGPNVYSANANVKNSYYFSNEIYNSNTDRKSTFLSLYDKEFQKKVLNSENAFEIENTVSQGYYPQLQMSECMPSQEYINLPEVQDSDLIDIISLEKLEENIENDTVKIKINVNNPSAETITEIQIKNIECEIESQEYVDGKSTVIAVLKNPILYVSSYSVKSITSVGAYNLPYTRKFEENERIIYIDLYRKITNVDDWNNINKSPTENYMLVKDLDLKNNINVTITSTFKGKLNGNNFTIKNVKSKLMNHIDNGSIENLNIQNVELTKLSDNKLSIFSQINNGVIDNVNLNNIKISNDDINSSISYVGGILGVLSSSTMRNCSVNNIEVNLYCDNSLGIGGLVGQGNRSLIENSYVNNLKFNINNLKITRIGGIIGYDGYGLEIKNTYTQGEIKSNTNIIGGIIGLINGSRIYNNYSNVNIDTTGEYLGGIAGYYGGNKPELKNNLVLGNIYTNKKTKNIDGIYGDNNFNVDLKNNYVYKKQKINGYYIEEKDLMLTTEELKSKKTYFNILKWTEGFYLEDVSKGILPKLYYTDNETLLPNQENLIVPTDNEIELHSVIATKDTINSAKIRIELINKNNIYINNIEIDGMDIKIDRISTSNGVTYIDIYAIPNKYYDTYKITNIVTYVNNKKDKVLINARIELQFFKEIYTYEDWQSIQANSYENYRIMQDIDFADKTNINKNLSIARLETDGEKRALKNIELEFNSPNEGLIKDIKDSLRNISFQNITINKTRKGENYTGIILNSSANISSIEVKEVTINSNTSNYVAAICNVINGAINDCLLENINIYSGSYSAGLVAYSTSSEEIKNIKVKNIAVEANGDYAGAVIGYAQNATLSEIDAEYCNITGNDGVGGISGYISGIDCVRGKSIEVNGNSKVGGIIGQSSTISTDIYLDEINVSGRGQYIGGVIGSSESSGITRASISNSDINGLSQNSKYLGGIIGKGGNCNYIEVNNCNVISNGTYVGGIFGYTLNTGGNYDFFVKDTYIEGYSNVGGAGNIRNAFVNKGYINANIVAISNAGGLLGSYDNIGMTESQTTSCIYEIIIADTNIRAKSNVGGLIGYISTELYYTSHIKFFYSNYIEADINSDTDNVSMGIGNRKIDNDKIKDMYIYRYSTINGKNIENTNDNFKTENMLIYTDLKEETTYTEKINLNRNNWNFDVLDNDKYPILNTNNCGKQEGIDLPVDSEHIVDNISTNSINKINMNDNNEALETEFIYNNKEILTFSTYSLVVEEGGNKTTRNAKFYLKDNNLYVIPVVLATISENEKITPVANNLIVDRYNGKEYETVLGTDGKIYDLKEPITYPENFVNKDIESIGNNLNSDEKDIEVTYKNGNKLKFNYQTGEVISSIEENRNKIGLFDYVKEKISQIGNSNFRETQKITNKYEESKVLQNKLEETPVEEALQRKNSNANKPENVANDENNETNNSLKEKRYISIYNTEKDEYQIYQEEELLDTKKQEVISENEKIEANNLKEYYASEGEAKNTKMGIVWIALSIIGVVIILFAIKKRD